MAKSKVLIENDKTIVTEWLFDVGDSTGHHTHKYNYIVVPMLDGELKVIDSNNNETISKLSKGGAYYRERGDKANFSFSTIKKSEKRRGKKFKFSNHYCLHS